MFNVLSTIGGIGRALHSGGLIFTRIFSYKLLMSSLIGKLFHFKARFPQEVEKRKKQKWSKIIVHDKIKKTVYEKPKPTKI